jgi:Holliday junction resolvase RusA-like endonuclease
MIALELYGEPIPLARPRLFKRRGVSTVFDSQAKLKEGCKWQLKSQYRGEPVTTPLFIEIDYFLPIPKSTSAIRRKQMLNGMIFHDRRPDIDNLVKFTLDCLNGLVIGDDSQVVELRSRKLYAEKPTTLIRLHTIGMLYEN